MLRRLDAIFSNRPPAALGALALAVSQALGWVDRATGYELSFSIFYLGPIAFVAWYAGRRWAAALCVVSAATWLVSDISSGHVYSHAAIPFWNATVRLGFFSISAALLVSLRAHLHNEEQLARHDSLTGLLNARAFKEQARAQFDLAARQRQPFAIGYLDLDDFKSVNDRLGHSEGDRALAEVAAVLASRLRRTDLAGRLGGDEFATLLPDTDLAGAERLFAELAEALREAFAAANWPLGVSLGVAAFDTPPESLDAALHAADELMYEVKAAGKNSLRARRIDGMRLADAARSRELPASATAS